MKKVLFTALIGLGLVACAREEDAGYLGGASQTETGTGAATSEDPAAPQTPVLPPASDTVAPSSIPTTSGDGTATDAEQRGTWENQNLDGAPVPPAGTGAQDPVVNTNGVGNRGTSRSENNGGTI